MTCGVLCCLKLVLLNIAVATCFVISNKLLVNSPFGAIMWV